MPIERRVKPDAHYPLHPIWTKISVGLQDFGRIRAGGFLHLEGEGLRQEA